MRTLLKIKSKNRKHLLDRFGQHLVVLALSTFFFAQPASALTEDTRSLLNDYLVDLVDGTAANDGLDDNQDFDPGINHEAKVLTALQSESPDEFTSSSAATCSLARYEASRGPPH